ncbi:UNVERIFIED_CONTAM: hypothetical protein FKN15_018150 [Acipenser sinensis]
MPNYSTWSTTANPPRTKLRRDEDEHSRPQCKPTVKPSQNCSVGGPRRSELQALPSTGVSDVSVTAVEGEQAVLDCYLPWHSLAIGIKDYEFAKAPNLFSSNDMDFRTLAVSKLPQLVLNQISLADQRAYRCALVSVSGVVLTTIYFRLIVTPSPPTSPKAQSNQTVSPSPPPQNASLSSPSPVTLNLRKAKNFVIGATTLSLLSCVVTLTCFIVCLNKQRDVWREEREENMKDMMEQVE